MNFRLLLIFCATACVTATMAGEPAMVIPKPWIVTTIAKPAMPLTATTALRLIDGDARPVADWLRLGLAIATGVIVSEPQNTAGDGIVLFLDPRFSVDAPE
ncbi:MAG TPA: hypothetical protein VHX44_12100 [Planctomycetota bacterium]|nr:hypothetical protein [Planctomycetota bacterium]